MIRLQLIMGVSDWSVANCNGCVSNWSEVCNGYVSDCSVACNGCVCLLYTSDAADES